MKQVSVKISLIRSFPVIFLFFIVQFPLMTEADGDPFPSTVTPPGSLDAFPGTDRIHLQWTEPEVGYITATGFSLYRSRDGETFELLVSVDRDIFSFEDTDVLTLRTYYYFARTDSDLGQSEKSQVVDSLADDRAPEVLINSPSPDEVIGVADTTVNFMIDEVGSGVESTFHSLDGGPPTDVSGENSIDLVGLDDGPHSITLSTSDRAGNSAEASRRFIIDTEPPELSILSPQKGDLISGAEVTVRWLTEDFTTDISEMLLSVDGGIQIDITGEEAYTISYLDSGEHRIILLARDEAGNTISDVVDFITDSDLPYVRIENPSNNSIISDRDLLLQWTGGDATTSVHYQVSVREGPWIDVADSTSYLIRDIDHGSADIQVRVIDSVMKTDHDSVRILIDRGGPDIRFSNENDPVMSSKGIVDLEWTITDEPAGVSRVEYKLDGEGPFIPDRSTGVRLRGLENGYHELEVIAYDTAGNSAMEKIRLFVDVIPPELSGWTPNGTIAFIPGNIDLVFSEEMDRESIELRTDRENARISGSGNHFTIDVGEELLFGDTYEFWVTGTDLNGMRMPRTKVSFTITDIAKIEGRVVDTEGRPVEGATITLDTGMVAFSGADGRFEIDERMGNRTVYVTKKGYERSENQIRTRPDSVNWAGSIRLIKEEKTTGEIISGFFQDPMNIILSSAFLILLIIGFSLMWNRIDREKITDVHVEWEDDID